MVTRYDEMTRCRDIKELGDLGAGVWSMGLQLRTLAPSFGSIFVLFSLSQVAIALGALVCFECSTATLYI
jgi:hypothetical protein